MLAAVALAWAGCAEAERPAPARTVSTILAEFRATRSILRRRACLRELSRAEPRTPAEVHGLAELARSPRLARRWSAYDCLGRVSAGALRLRTAYRALVDDPSFHVNVAAMAGVATLGDREAIPRVRALLRRVPPQPIRSHDFSRVDRDRFLVVAMAGETLAKLGSIESLEELLARDEMLALGPYGAHLGRLGAAALPSLVREARRKNPFRVDGALAAIAHIEDPVARPRLRALLKDPDRAIARAARIALAPPRRPMLP